MNIALMGLCAAPLCAEEVGRDYLEALDPGAHDIVIVGEVHDNGLHHLNQAVVLQALEPKAVVFEMLTPEQAEVANGVFATLDEMEVALDWAASGWPDFELYAPVFHVLKGFDWVLYPPESEDFGGSLIFLPERDEARIYGAEVARDAAQEAFEAGAAAVFGEDAGRFGLDRALPEAEQSAREEAQLAAHCGALPVEVLPGFVEAQRLRDARLAEVALQALEETGGPVVVITGNGHARANWGMPALLAMAAPEVRVLSIGQLEAAEEAAPFDAWIETEAVERDDPCAVFEN